MVADPTLGELLPTAVSLAEEVSWVGASAEDGVISGTGVVDGDGVIEGRSSAGAGVGVGVVAGVGGVGGVGGATGSAGVVNLGSMFRSMLGVAGVVGFVLSSICFLFN